MRATTSRTLQWRLECTWLWSSSATSPLLEPPSVPKSQVCEVCALWSVKCAPCGLWIVRLVVCELCALWPVKCAPCGLLNFWFYGLRIFVFFWSVKCCFYGKGVRCWVVKYGLWNSMFCRFCGMWIIMVFCGLGNIILCGYDGL